MGRVIGSTGIECVGRWCCGTWLACFGCSDRRL